MDLRANRHWAVEPTDAWAEEDPDCLFDNAVPVPVLEFSPRWLRWWSRLLTGRRRAADAAVLLASDKPRPTVATHESGEELAAWRLANFRSVASPQAQHLAQLAAAVPVTLELAQLIQQAFQDGRIRSLWGN